MAVSERVLMAQQVPAGLPPDWPSLAGLAGLVAAAGGIVAALTKQVLDYARDRAAGRDNATFRSELVKQMQTLAGQVGTYEQQIDALEDDVIGLRSANKRLTEEFQLATKERDELEGRVAGLTRRVKVLERRNTLYARTLTEHGIPIPIDGDSGEDAE